MYGFSAILKGLFVQQERVVWTSFFFSNFKREDIFSLQSARENFHIYLLCSETIVSEHRNCSRNDYDKWGEIFPKFLYSSCDINLVLTDHALFSFFTIKLCFRNSRILKTVIRFLHVTLIYWQQQLLQQFFKINRDIIGLQSISWVL